MTIQDLYSKQTLLSQLSSNLITIGLINKNLQSNSFEEFTDRRLMLSKIIL